MVIGDEVVCCPILPQLFHTFFSIHNPLAHPLPSSVLLMLCFLSHHPPKRKTPQRIFHMLPSPVHHSLFSCFTGCFFSMSFVSFSILYILIYLIQRIGQKYSGQLRSLLFQPKTVLFASLPKGNSPTSKNQR